MFIEINIRKTKWLPKPRYCFSQKFIFFFFLEKSKKQEKEACSYSVEKYDAAIYENLFA